MSKSSIEPPERLRVEGATDFERRLLAAASADVPSRELSERMARAIGVPLSAVGNSAPRAGEGASAVRKATGVSKALGTWFAGGAGVVLVVAAAIVARYPASQAAPSSAAMPTVSASGGPLAAAPSSGSPASLSSSIASVAAPAGETLPEESAPLRLPATAASQRARHSSGADALANQIALVDAARRSLAASQASRALSLVNEYQSKYPSGTFGPEVAAIKIEALLKAGRSAEARSLAERFVAAYGQTQSPLARRVARVAGISPP